MAIGAVASQPAMDALAIFGAVCADAAKAAKAIAFLKAKAALSAPVPDAC